MSAIGPARWLLVVALLALVNVPVVASLATDRRIATEGVATTAEVTDAGQEGDRYALLLRFDAEVDPARRAWPVVVERETWQQARESGELAVRAVPGDPGAFDAPGEVRSRTGLWMTLLGNVLVAAWVAAMLRRARRRRVEPGDDDGEPDRPAG